MINSGVIYILFIIIFFIDNVYTVEKICDHTRGVVSSVQCVEESLTDSCHCVIYFLSNSTHVNLVTVHS